MMQQAPAQVDALALSTGSCVTVSRSDSLPSACPYKGPPRVCEVDSLTGVAPSNRTRRWLRSALNELLWREHSQAAKGGFVVVVDPAGTVLQDGAGLWARLDTGIVAFECFDECFTDAVAFRAAHWREAGNEGKGGCEVQRFADGVG